MKKIIPFFAGMLSLALLLATVPMSLAAPAKAPPLEGKVTYNQVGVALFSKVKVAPGQTRTAANGQQVPTVLTYTDALGGKNHYLSAQTAAELFDVYRGVYWNAKLNCIDFSTRADTSIVMVKEGEEPPKNLPSGSIVITVGSGEDEKKPDTTPTKPELGRKAGPYTEIAPTSVKMDWRPIVLTDGRLSESSTGLDQMIYFAPENGTVLVITVTNHSKVDVYMNVMRPYAVGYGGYNQFTSAKLAPGKTMVRAFRVDKDIEDLEKSLRLIVDTHEMGWMTDVTYTVEQLREP